MKCNACNREGLELTEQDGRRYCANCKANIDRMSTPAYRKAERYARQRIKAGNTPR